MSEALNKYEKNFEAGDVIFCEYERGDEFYIIKEGKVRITKIQDNKEKTLDVFSPPSLFGEMAIIEDAPRSATAIATTDVTLVVLQRHNFYELLVSNPQWALSLIKILSKRIFDAQRRLSILSLEENDAKVLDTLLMLTEWKGIDPYKAGAIKVELEGANSEAVSHWCGISPTECEEHLNRYVKMGRIELTPDKIIIKNIADTARMVTSKRKLQEKEDF